MSNCDCQKSDCNCGSNSGFIFGLLCGAIIGAIIAIIIYKNNKTEVFDKLQEKVKDFFEKLTGNKTARPTNHQRPLVAKSLPKKISPVSEPKEIKPVFVKAKKPVPKTFIKPKK